MMTDRNSGFTLFEVLVAVLLLAIISSMIYSVLNVGIRFSDQGEKKILSLERQAGLLSLLRRQVQGGWYDAKQRKVIVSAEDNLLRVITTAPLLQPGAGVVAAFYRFDPNSEALYYQEKRDFFNTEYDDQYQPDFEDMHLLLEEAGPLEFGYDEDSKVVQVMFMGEEYEFFPWCR